MAEDGTCLRDETFPLRKTLDIILKPSTVEVADVADRQSAREALNKRENGAPCSHLLIPLLPCFHKCKKKKKKARN